MAELQTIRSISWGEMEIRGPVHLFRERLMMRLFCPLLQNGCVLDVGCGSGSFAFDLCRSGYRVEAIERSVEFIEMVRHKMHRFGAEARMAVHQGCVTQLPFDDQSFDGVVCGEVLEHITPDLGGDQAAVRELHRVSKKGAACVVSVPLNPKLWDDSDEWAGHVKRYTLEALVEILESSGFSVCETKVWGFPLGRIYHRLLFAPWIRKTGAMKPEQREGRFDTRTARNRKLVDVAASALRFDELFSDRTWGRGIVVAARRRD